MVTMIVLLAAWSCSMLGFGMVAGKDCPAPSPCLCNGDDIECRGHKFDSVPTFHLVSEHYRILRLGVNNVTTILPSAFASLNVTEIHLDFNHISTIDPEAFSGMENKLRILDLSHNRLTTLPEALSKLTYIAELDISYNPIDGHYERNRDNFTDSVMKAMGDSLVKFTFGDDFMLNWPDSLDHLVQLQELNLAGSMIYYLSPEAFHGMEHTVTSLSISHSSFMQLPLAIGKLDKVTELHFDYNRIDDGNSVILAQPLTAVNTTLTTLSLRYDRLKVVPEVLKDLRNLQNISLDGNPLEFISDEAISFIKDTTVRILSFRDCGLKRIPGSVSDLHNLIELDFSQNQIRTIENSDLRSIPSLKTLTLAKNPLKYISRDSFTGLRGVSLLDLSKTSITKIPESIANLDSLKILDFSHARIECTCDMSWVRRFMDFVNITIKGACETIDSDIQPYVLNRVPTCLDYLAYFNTPLG